MRPIVTPQQMRDIDAAAQKTIPVTTLINRAGSAVATAAIDLMGGTYGRRVVVLVGPGNNGADGRIAAQRLAARGAQVQVIEAATPPCSIPPCDLVIDAVFGTGFRGDWRAPDVGTTPVLAVDIPSGVNGITGAVAGRALTAVRTVTFAALKPGLLFPPGAQLAGRIDIVDIGLGCGDPRTHLVEPDDVAQWCRPRAVDAHKWRAATRVIAGSSGMTGSAHLVAAAAQRSGAGMVHLSVPGVVLDGFHEYVERPLPAHGWATEVLHSLDRFQSLVIGPGLGRDDATVASAREVIRRASVPTVVDGDGLFALAWSPQGAAALLHERRAPTVLTPHDGEFSLLAGAPPEADRLQAARRLAFDLRSVVLLKGAATVIAEPTGRALVVNAGDERLATAGTGDVLAGVIAALLAQEVAAFEAAAAGAWIHARAAMLGHRRGLIASDLLALIPSVLESLV